MGLKESFKSYIVHTFVFRLILYLFIYLKKNGSYFDYVSLYIDSYYR